MKRKKDIDKVLITDWVQAGITHLEDAGTVGSMVEHPFSDEADKVVVTMTIVLPSFLAPLVRAEIEKIMDGAVHALVEAKKIMADSESEQNITKH